MISRSDTNFTVSSFFTGHRGGSLSWKLWRKSYRNIVSTKNFCRGSVGYNKSVQGSETSNDSAQSSSTMLAVEKDDRARKTISGSDKGIFPTEGLQGSRRDIMRFRSLGIAISCLVLAFSP
ncbi:uncharacterized protein LOC107645845 isoform X3 [Arachis ipaensis]|uniref:uncharacterized protein LOC107645845 isoform X3 n=1 Tax=Arachis ipaensis TaxID=130454 RepID=UPI000A2B448C|nr:uncharacterized protein LOC107645845 isoform X3 [Arachis ipaensis]